MVWVEKTKDVRVEAVADRWERKAEQQRNWKRNGLELEILNLKLFPVGGSRQEDGCHELM